jgi:hypothetical protein
MPPRYKVTLSENTKRFLLTISSCRQEKERRVWCEKDLTYFGYKLVQSELTGADDSGCGTNTISTLRRLFVQITWQLGTISEFCGIQRLLSRVLMLLRVPRHRIGRRRANFFIKLVCFTSAVILRCNLRHHPNFRIRKHLLSWQVGSL